MAWRHFLDAHVVHPGKLRPLPQPGRQLVEHSLWTTGRHLDTTVGQVDRLPGQTQTFGLLARRIFVDRVRYITSPSDIAMLILLILIGISGILMTFVWHTDVTAVTHFFRSVIWPVDGIPGLPGDPVLWIHLLLVVALMIVFPISKLLHAPGVFFSPSRNMVDNPREQRHVVDWAKKLEQN